MNFDPLDDDFPLGDGVADTEAVVQCPYCGESVILALDPSDAPVSEYVEDCEVCCQPWQVRVTYHGGHADVLVTALDD